MLAQYFVHLHSSHMPQHAPDFGWYENTETEDGFIVFLNRLTNTTDLDVAIPEWLSPFINEAKRFRVDMLLFSPKGDIYPKFRVYEHT